VTSRRLGPGRVRPDVDVFWDLAAHDLAILDHVLPAWSPLRIRAHGASPGVEVTSAGSLTVESSCGTTAEIVVSWMSSVKERLLIMRGSRRTAIWDDLEVDALRLSAPRDTETSVEVVPTSDREPLARLVAEFAHSVRTGEVRLSGGDAGLRVLRALEAARESLELDGAYVSVLHDAPFWSVSAAAGGGA
jgi:predicted dehydrogenase